MEKNLDQCNLLDQTPSWLWYIVANEGNFENFEFDELFGENGEELKTIDLLKQKEIVEPKQRRNSWFGGGIARIFRCGC